MQRMEFFLTSSIVEAMGFFVFAFRCVRSAAIDLQRPFRFKHRLLTLYEIYVVDWWRHIIGSLEERLSHGPLVSQGDLDLFRVIPKQSRPPRKSEILAQSHSIISVVQEYGIVSTFLCLCHGHGRTKASHVMSWHLESHG